VTAALDQYARLLESAERTEVVAALVSLIVDASFELAQRSPGSADARIQLDYLWGSRV
jgi:hypothetical protein